MDKCINREEVDEHGTPHTTHIMYNYEFIDDFDQPLLGRVGNFLLKTVLHYKPESGVQDFPLVMINHQSENGDQNLFQSTLTAMPTKSHSIAPVSQNWGPKVYQKDNHIISLMVRMVAIWCLTRIHIVCACMDIEYCSYMHVHSCTLVLSCIAS